MANHHELTPSFPKTPAHRTGTAPHGAGRIPLLKTLPFVLLAAASAVFSIPFFKSIRFSWTEMNVYLQGVVFSLAAALFYLSWLGMNFRNTLLLFLISFAVSYAVEFAGVHWALFFGGSYHYSLAILPALPGKIPLCIPLMWFTLGYTPLVFLRRYSIRPYGSLEWRRVLLKSAWCALFIMAADYVIEPLAVLSEAWLWHEPGAYFGAPLRNFTGWFTVGLIVCGCYLLLENPPADGIPKNWPFSTFIFGPVSIFLTMLCFLACAVHTKSILPVALAWFVMAPCWIYWIVSNRKVRGSHGMNKPQSEG
jgi:uncharacterized membrane protein